MTDELTPEDITPENIAAALRSLADQIHVEDPFVRDEATVPKVGDVVSVEIAIRTNERYVNILSEPIDFVVERVYDDEGNGPRITIDGRKLARLITDTAIRVAVTDALEEAGRDKEPGEPVEPSNPAMKYEYATTTGPRKAWDNPDQPPEGEGWELDPDRGHPGESWERFDYHEERYWRRLREPWASAAVGKADCA